MFVVWWLFNWLFTIKQVTCDFGKTSCPTKTQTSAESILGKRLIFVHKNKLIDQIKHTDFQINSVTVKFKLPAQAFINISLTSQFAKITDPISSKSAIISSEYQVVATQSAQNLPEFITDQPINLSLGSDLSNTEFKTSLDLLVSLIDNLIPVTKLTRQSTVNVATLKTGQTSLFDTNQNLGGQIRALQLIISNIESLEDKIIDVRYSPPVLRSRTEPATTSAEATDSAKPTPPQE